MVGEPDKVRPVLWSIRDVSIDKVWNVLIIIVGLIGVAELSSVAILTLIWTWFPAFNCPIFQILSCALEF